MPIMNKAKERVFGCNSQKDKRLRTELLSGGIPISPSITIADVNKNTMLLNEYGLVIFSSFESEGTRLYPITIDMKVAKITATHKI